MTSKALSSHPVTTPVHLKPDRTYTAIEMLNKPLPLLFCCSRLVTHELGSTQSYTTVGQNQVTKVTNISYGRAKK